MGCPRIPDSFVSVLSESLHGVFELRCISLVCILRSRFSSPCFTGLPVTILGKPDRKGSRTGYGGKGVSLPQRCRPGCRDPCLVILDVLSFQASILTATCRCVDAAMLPLARHGNCSRIGSPRAVSPGKAIKGLAFAWQRRFSSLRNRPIAINAIDGFELFP